MPALASEAAQDGFRLEHIASIGSTSAELMARARAGETGPLWLVADEQTAGRGRRARQWRSPKGNLYASLLLRDAAPAEAVAQLSLVLALALRDAVTGFARGRAAPAEIKWPNDLMLGGRKTAGLLLEGGGGGDKRFVVAGFGVNIVSHPEGTTHPATHLEAEGYYCARDALFTQLSAAVVARLALWRRGEGIEFIRTDWQSHAYGLGRPMTINTAAESFTATPRGLDDAGRLIVLRDGRELAVSSAEVFDLASRLEPAR
jgi:BirA family biotin operon repressor/biotin-[acetyl-CoA-carboxylase] ligase